MAYNWKTSSHFWIQMLDLNDIVVFARVVEAGSFTAAARLLGMPKTTVSRRIAALERAVGVRLVQRTTRSLNMTDAGRLYYEQSSQALRTIEDANLRLAEARAEPSGTIRISAPVGFGGHFLTSAAFDFLAAYPKTKVELHLTDDTLNLVGNRIDLAFRTGLLPDSTLIARKLASTHRILCASPDYLARRGVPVASATSLAITASLRAHRPAALNGCWTGRVGRKRRCLDASPPMKCRRWLPQRLQATASLNCPTRSPRRLSGAGGCAAFSATTRRRLAGFMPCIRAADTFRLWSRNSSSLQPSDWPPPGPARMTRL